MRIFPCILSLQIFILVTVHSVSFPRVTPIWSEPLPSLVHEEPEGDSHCPYGGSLGPKKEVCYILLGYHDSLESASAACESFCENGDVLHPKQVDDAMEALEDHMDHWRIQGQSDDSCWLDAHGNEVEGEINDDDDEHLESAHGPSLVLYKANDTIMEVPADEKTPFVCQRRSNKSRNGGCSEDLGVLSKGGWCFRFVNMAMSYKEAHDYCKKHGEELLTAENLRNAMDAYDDCCLADIRLNAERDGDACIVGDDGEPVDTEQLEKDNYVVNVNARDEDEEQNDDEEDDKALVVDHETKEVWAREANKAYATICHYPAARSSVSLDNWMTGSPDASSSTVSYGTEGSTGGSVSYETGSAGTGVPNALGSSSSTDYNTVAYNTGETASSTEASSAVTESEGTENWVPINLGSSSSSGPITMDTNEPWSTSEPPTGSGFTSSASEEPWSTSDPPTGTGFPSTADY